MADFSIELDASLDLSIQEIWPDGDAPDNPTVDDVLKVLSNHGSVGTVLGDWGFSPEWRVYKMPMVTKTGRVLTDHDLKEFADEAEAGYEVTGLTERADRREGL